MTRIFIFYNLIYSIFLSLLPKTLRHFLPKSPTQNEQDGKSDACVMEALNVFDQNDTVSSPPPPQPPCSSRLTHHHLHRIFQLFDKNNDGNITKQELNESLRAMNIFVPELDLVHMINKVDANNDGCVDLDEFGDLYNLIMDEQDDQDGKSDACVMEAFNVFDQNRDGFIAVDELGSVLESLGLKPVGKSDDCRRMIMKVDVDGDGRVSFSEFKEMMRSGGLGCLAEN